MDLNETSAEAGRSLCSTAVEVKKDHITLILEANNPLILTIPAEYVFVQSKKTHCWNEDKVQEWNFFSFYYIDTVQVLGSCLSTSKKLLVFQQKLTEDGEKNRHKKQGHGDGLTLTTVAPNPGSQDGIAAIGPKLHRVS